MVRMSQADFAQIPKEAVRSVKAGSYGVEALVYKQMIRDAFTTEHTTIEEIILFLVKGVNNNERPVTEGLLCVN